jgi:hypothetical protein
MLSGLGRGVKALRIRPAGRSPASTRPGLHLKHLRNYASSGRASGEEELAGDERNNAVSRAAAHHIGRYPLDEPEANFHVQECLAGRSVLRATCFLGGFSRTSFVVFSVESGAETVVETGGFDRTEDDGFERMSGATKGASEYCTIIAGGGL